MTPPTPALRASSMPKSAIREIMALAAGRSGMIHLEVGEPEFSTPGHIIEGALQAAREGWTKYTPNAGIPSLRALIAERYAKSRNIQITPDQVTVTVGAIGALFTAVMVVADPGDEVLIPDPGWPNYESIVHLAAAKPVRYLQRGENGFLPRPEDLKRLITPATRAILVNSPGNPTGAVFPGELVQAIADLAREHGIFVISDEIYEDIVFEDGHVSFSGRGIDDRTLIVSGVSKTYAMTGWRLGYLIAPPELGSICAALQEPIISSAPTVSQKASEIALSGPQACVAEFRSIFRRRRDIFVEEFKGSDLLPSVPDGAFYGLIDIERKGMGSLDFAKSFLLEKNVAVVPGETFGPSCDRFVRVAFTIGDDDLREGLRRLRDYILA